MYLLYAIARKKQFKITRLKALLLQNPFADLVLTTWWKYQQVKYTMYNLKQIIGMPMLPHATFLYRIPSSRYESPSYATSETTSNAHQETERATLSCNQGHHTIFFSYFQWRSEVPTFDPYFSIPHGNEAIRKNFQPWWISAVSRAKLHIFGDSSAMAAQVKFFSMLLHVCFPINHFVTLANRWK